MATKVHSTRLGPHTLPLLERQAARKQINPSALSAIYLTEKTLEEEYPGIGFRDAAAGREAYLQGHRVAVWQVEDVFLETKSVSKTAKHFRWPESLVKCALLFACEFPEDVAAQRAAERP